MLYVLSCTIHTLVFKIYPNAAIIQGNMRIFVEGILTKVCSRGA